ncbi:hypothetical protein SAMN05877809_1018 [Rhodobacter sp. JA431]|uniref:hypothetical protein n=1 Tax=Rhodobacter sp. JA431 TaxID=570013 RepID=UPI000BD3869B|nr:hypothetical protein [Rhodobacter sp. JA431]SOB89444.1 hypothetical protein SAMN05877809_1018 [Rhodobacter sp. JA431]
MLNDLVACAGPSVACIILDGRFEARSLAELAIIDAKQSYPEIRSVLLESPLGEERKTDKVTWPFDARLYGPVSRARLKWAIVAGTVVQS